MSTLSTDSRPTTTISVVVEVDVNEAAWTRTMGAGDAYDRAEAQPSRSLVADVEDYIRQAVADSPAAAEGAIVNVDTTFDCERPWPRAPMAP